MYLFYVESDRHTWPTFDFLNLKKIKMPIPAAAKTTTTDMTIPAKAPDERPFLPLELCEYFTSISNELVI